MNQLKIGFMNTKDKTMRYLIDTKDGWGNYKSYDRTFENDQHYDNWERKMMNYGIKVIGLEEVEEQPCSQSTMSKITSTHGVNINNNTEHDDALHNIKR